MFFDAIGIFEFESLRLHDPIGHISTHDSLENRDFLRSGLLGISYDIIPFTRTLYRLQYPPGVISPPMSNTIVLCNCEIIILHWRYWCQKIIHPSKSDVFETFRITSWVIPRTTYRNHLLMIKTVLFLYNCMVWSTVHSMHRTIARTTTTHTWDPTSWEVLMNIWEVYIESLGSIFLPLSGPPGSIPDREIRYRWKFFGVLIFRTKLMISY